MNEIFKFISELSSVELIELKKKISEQITEVCCSNGSNAKIIEQSEKNRKMCPHCNIVLYKNGRTKSGVQKYICKQCHYTCSQTTGTVTFASKLPFEKWQLMIDNLLDGLSIRLMAKKSEVSVNTAFSMRHKIIQTISNYIKASLSGNVQLDEKHIKINLKGTKSQNMPRYSKKRKSAGSAGINNHLICLLTGIDEFDNLIIKVGGLGKTTIDMLNANLSDVITPNSLITADSEKSYIKFCKKNKLKLIRIPSKKHCNENGDNIAEINNVHSQLDTWLSSFRGVSTKHLPKYLDWFCYIFMFTKRWEYKELEIKMYKDIINGVNFIKRENISKREYPIDLYEAYGEYNYGIYA